jgi:hypothetical protein
MSYLEPILNLAPILATMVTAMVTAIVVRIAKRQATISMGA